MKEFQNRYSAMFRRSNAVADDCAENCPPAGALSDLAAGRTWPWRRRGLVEHLSHCSACADDFRVLTNARGGLVTALETHAHDSAGAAPAWLRPGLAAAALAVFTALGVTVLVETGGPGPVAESGVIFASEFEPRHDRRRGHENTEEQLFTSDFGEHEGEGGRLFRDDFGG